MTTCGDRSRGPGETEVTGRTSLKIMPSGSRLRAGRGGRSIYTSRRKTFHYEDTSNGWTLEGLNCRELVLECGFNEEILGENTNLFCLAFIEKLTIELRVLELKGGRAGSISLCVDPASQQSME